MVDARLLLLLIVFLSACSGDNNAPAPDAGDTADVATPDAQTADAQTPDAGSDAATPEPDAATDDGIDALVSLGGGELQLERAFFGITDASLTDSGETELHVEAHRGGGSACPSEDSPSPDQTVIITNVKLPASDGATQVEADNLAVSYLDFASELTSEVVLSATGESVTWGSYTAEALDFTVDAPIDGGTIEGRIVATHCPSMDLNP